MSELRAILTDVKAGNLPAAELLPFLGYLMRRAAWICAGVVFALGLALGLILAGA